MRDPMFVDGNTQASNPARLRIQFWRWVRTLSFRQFAYLGVFLLLIPLGYWTKMLGDWTFQAAFLLPLVSSLFVVWQAREYFWYGDVNPGVVVSLRPPLIAVSGDLVAGGAPCPVVKVLPHRLNQMSGAPFQIGDRLATVALYEGSGESGAWDDFHPIAANAVTSDRSEIARVLASIPDDEWRELQQGLQQIPSPPTLGLYHGGNQSDRAPRHSCVSSRT